MWRWLPLVALGCIPAAPQEVAKPAPPEPAPPLSATALSETLASTAAPEASAAPPPFVPPVPEVRACPPDMELVDTVYCPDARHRCLKDSRNAPNNLTICHQYAPGQHCAGPVRRQRFCIDRYEYPSIAGEHPPVMVSAYDAAAMCAEIGKRLCFESEWTAACEGPDKQPFPYGLERSSAHCNIDNPYIHPNLDKVHHPRDEVRGPELLRLDQSARSGERTGCKSGFGVHDLTGNFDEWVRLERKRGKGRWAGLKGGAWGHVRNACRPITTSHVPQWSYYFISFRCCKDPDPAATFPAPDDGIPLWLPPADPPPPHPANKPLDRGWTPKPQTPPGKAPPTASPP